MRWAPLWFLSACAVATIVAAQARGQHPLPGGIPAANAPAMDAVQPGSPSPVAG